MSEQTVIEGTIVDETVAVQTVPFYKNKKILTAAAAATAVVVGVVIYKFTKNENDEDSYETVSEDAILNALNSDTSLTEK